MTGNFRTQAKGPKSSVPRRGCWLAIAATATFAMFGLSGPNAEAQPQAGQVSFSTASLYPNFSPTVHDYVVRCHDAGVTVTASAQAGWEASINGHAFRSGAFSEPVPLGSGKAFTVTFREDGGTKLYHYYTRCLPDDFPHYTFRRLAPSSSPKFFTADSWAKPFHFGAVFDTNGVPVWWDHTGAFYTRMLPSGNLLRCVSGTWGIHRLSDSSTIRVLSGVGMKGNQHDLQFRTSNHDHLVGDYIPRQHVDLSAYGGPADAIGPRCRVAGGHGRWSARLGLEEPAPHLALGNGFALLGRNRGTGRAITTSSTGIRSTPRAPMPCSPPSVISTRSTRSARRTGNIIWKLGGSHTPRASRCSAIRLRSHSGVSMMPGSFPTGP